MNKTQVAINLLCIFAILVGVWFLYCFKTNIQYSYGATYGAGLFDFDFNFKHGLEKFFSWSCMSNIFKNLLEDYEETHRFINAWLDLLFGLSFIISAIVIYFRRDWGRRWMILVSFLSLLSNEIMLYTITASIKVPSFSNIIKELFNREVGLLYIGYCSFAFYFIFIIFFTRPKVKEQFK